MTQIIFDLKPEQKEKIQKASREKGLAVASFCRMILIEESRKILDEEKNAKPRK